MVDTQCCLLGLRRNYVAFWVSGLLNNFLYVVMNAGANSINESGIGFVYLANVVPTLFVKATGPYWFHLVSYRRRVLFCALMMVSSLMTVAWSDTSHLKLLGVCMASVSVGIGESSFLGMAAFYDKQPCIKSWSSGTGFAGIAGYMWAILFGAIGACFQVQLMMGLWIPLAWVLTFECLLERPWIDTVRDDLRRGHSIANDEIGALKFGIPYMDAGDAQTVAATGEVDRPITEYLSFRSRFMFIIRLWPYMVPLTTVFAAEYTIQAGFWTVIGFPVTDKKSRQEWYRRPEDYWEPVNALFRP
ncbi:unnamed protein product [Prorocentrum cordatum]|uniref:Protein BTN n=1 Tax=Prorocentrum cordatum TaxID=2364126 RepID=A0ABN9TJK1_9DINO|nr:unnamed protein product [Polarella glacialis]